MNMFVSRFVLALLVAVLYACSDSDSSSGAEIGANVLVDSRDSRTYRTIEIGGRVWMAENLNYQGQNDISLADDSLRMWSGCYNDSALYCEKQGRLYQWDAAMTACPEGWMLPSKADFDSLIDAVGGFDKASDSLISLGFIADLHGGYYFMGYFSYFDEYAYFWMRDEVRNLNARSVVFANGSSGVSYDETYEPFALSVRCVRNR